jgi:hypothetical protein
MPACYAITAGSYSDYHVCAVFTTRELAESECFMYGTEKFAQYRAIQAGVA